MAAAVKEKDAQIAALTAEVARLKAALENAPAPAAATPAPAASSAPVAVVQTQAPLAPAPSTNEEQVVKMSAFEVRTTQGAGYSAGNAASALKGSKPLMDLPAQIIVLTSDIIKDIGAFKASDVLAYAGVSSYYRGPTVESRGSRVGNPYLDDVPQSLPSGVSDNVNIDSYQVIKGPVQIFYPLASLGGTVLETTKKPLPGVKQYILDESIQQWGQQRFTFDFNGPVGYLGETRVTYRVEGVVQTGQGPFYNVKEDHYGIFPNIEFDYKNSSVILSYDAQILYYLPGGTSMLTPTGGLYTGNGRRVEGAPPGDHDRNEQHDVKGIWTQKISDNWQVRSQALYWNFMRYGTGAFPSTVNWNTNKATYTVRLDDARTAVANVQSDAIGKYSLGMFPNESAFGFNMQESTGLSEFWQSPTVTIPIGSADAINGIVLPAPWQNPEPANPGSRSEQFLGNVYYMHSIDVIPNWLTLVGGFTFSKIETVSDTNIAVAGPYLATDLNGHSLLHRIAAIGHLGKDVSMYVSESTTFSPSSGVTYQNTPLPPVLGKSDEVGVKTAFWDGRVSASFAVYKMQLTNQAILAAFPALNIAGANYYIPIGTTTSKGWDASMALQLVSGWQIIATGYEGTVHDQNGNPVTATYETQWSVFTRYDLPKDGPLKGLGIGGGVNRIGGRWFNMASLTVPGGAANPVNSSGVALFKLHEGTMMNLFADYELNRHWTFRVNCENVLDQAYPLGAQGVGLVDPSDPRTFTFETTFKF